MKLKKQDCSIRVVASFANYAGINLTWIAKLNCKFVIGLEGENLKKIYIVGIVASGKTTLAKQISKKINLPWYELDSIVHQKTKEGRYKRTPSEQVEIIKEIDKNGNWIFEGTERESYRCLFEMADTIIFLDTPLWKRRLRIIIRYLKQNLGLEKCNYKPDITMLKMMYKWTRDFERNRVNFEAGLDLYKNKVIRLSDNKNINSILDLAHTNRTG